MKLINLVPKFRQQELRYEALLGNLLAIISLSLLSFALVFVCQFGVRFYLQAEAGALNSEINQLQSQVNKQENASLKSKIQKINDAVSDFNNLANTSPKLSKVIKAFASLPPAGVSINNLTIDGSKKTITITGRSPTRELVIQTYTNILRDSDNFYNINYPLENVVKATDINFHFNFNIQDKLLK